MLLLLVLPLLTLLRYSFNKFTPGQLMSEAFILDNYIKFFAEPYFREVMTGTFGLAAICTVSSVALGYPVAYMLARTHTRWKSVLIILVLFPLLVGNVVRAAGWTIFLSRDGLLNHLVISLGLSSEPLQFMYTNTAVFVGLMSVMLPFVILTLLGVLEGLDFTLFDAARNLGASPATAFRRVILPLSIPGVSAASVLVFTIGMNSYATPVLLGGAEFRMMAPTVYQQFALVMNWPFGAALAFILIAVTGGASVLSSLFLARQNRLLGQ
ncbi:ABC transporter permease [Ferrovibrio sp.]|uniref:ABC transporter permease n=1 Tax=Ferrovibrio sp. TaxID=1917215 RepID=UPI003D2B1991